MTAEEHEMFVFYLVVVTFLFCVLNCNTSQKITYFIKRLEILSLQKLLALVFTVVCSKHLQREGKLGHMTTTGCLRKKRFWKNTRLSSVSRLFMCRYY